jgi:hypothetical protein
MKKKNDPMVILRGHKTSDIPGVKSVIGANSLPALAQVLIKIGHCRVIGEYGRAAIESVRGLDKSKRDRYFIGGTAYLWWKLKPYIKYEFDFYGDQVDNFTIKALGNKKISGKDCVMIFEKVTSKGKVTALYGSSPQATGKAAATWVDLRPLHGSYRLVIADFHGNILLWLEY